MQKRENEFGTNKIIMYPVFSVVYPLTQSPLQLKATVEFIPGDFVPEYMDAQNAIRQKLHNQKHTIEGAAKELLDFFNGYEPKQVQVKVRAENNNTFFPVEVIAEINKQEQIEELKLVNGAERNPEKIIKKNDKKDEKPLLNTENSTGIV